MKDFVEYWLLKTLDAQWYWYRFEYQAWDSTHAHRCAKLHNDPGLCELARKAASGWLAAQTQQISQSNQQLQVLVEEGQQAQTRLRQCVDWLVTTVNDALPSNTDWVYPSPHPCSQSYLDINEEDIDLDYINLVMNDTQSVVLDTAFR